MELRNLRKKAGVSQEELAQRVNVSTGYISHLETGRRDNPSIQLLTKIADALNVTVTDLLEKRAG